jgi:hypothetical protein
MVSCAACGGVAFCHCLARFEDIAREMAEEQAREDDRAWMDMPHPDDAAFDGDFEMRRGRASEERQAAVDRDRRCP